LAAPNAVNFGLATKSPVGMLCKSGFTLCANLQLKALASNSFALKSGWLGGICRLIVTRKIFTSFAHRVLSPGTRIENIWHPPGLLNFCRFSFNQNQICL
jgi:hypothetical protein